ncbi:MAG: D-alanyl-D-alanine carboxypeptidase [Actinomycetota bacterium]|nr:D-alanyl-D-alanine carboxypeptidase [Actinomycetota bacterium]
MPAASWVLVDSRSGDVLAGENPKTAFPLASATKLMTYYVAAGRLRPAREIAVAPYDPVPGESLAGFEPGDSITARDAFYGLMVPSGNDAAHTLALAASGSESDFVARMNGAADELGLEETSYADPIGLAAGNVSSARDLIDLATELQEQALFRRIVDTESATLRSGSDPLRIETRNALLSERPFVDGIKTGTTLEAGYVLVGSGTRKGVGLTSVVLGSPDEAARDAATLELLDYGFSLYEKRRLVAPGERVGSVPLVEGGRLPLVAAKEVEAVARADQEVRVRVKPLEPVDAPIARGDPVGTASVRLDGRRVGTVRALASRSVAGLPEGREDTAGAPRWVWISLGAAVLVSALLGALAVASHRRE